MSYELTGKLAEKFDIVKRSETFKTREFVIEKAEDAGGRTFTSYIKFQCVQDRTTIVDAVNIGDNVKVHFNIRGTKWEKDGRISYITNLDAWRIEALLPNAGTQQRAGQQEDMTNMSFSSGEDNDLPF